MDDCPHCDEHSLQYPEEYIGHILLHHVEDGTLVEDEKLYDVLARVRYHARIAGLEDAIDHIGEPQCDSCESARQGVVNRKRGFVNALDEWEDN